MGKVLNKYIKQIKKKRIRGVFNKFPDFFVQAFIIVVDS